MKKWSTAVLVALFMAMAIALVPKTAAADDNGYIDCMNSAIVHKYALIDAGWSYAAAHAHYLEHTVACYRVFYQNGPYLNTELEQ